MCLKSKINFLTLINCNNNTSSSKIKMSFIINWILNNRNNKLINTTKTKFYKAKTKIIHSKTISHNNNNILNNNRNIYKNQQQIIKIILIVI
jgi:hypothetical protein